MLATGITRNRVDNGMMATPDTKAVDRILSHWGQWVRSDNGVGYSGSLLGRMIRKRRQEIGGESNCDLTLCGADLIDDVQALAVDRAIASLPGDLRSALKMRYVQLLPNIMGAARMRVSERTFERYLSKSRLLLAKML